MTEYDSILLIIKAVFGAVVVVGLTVYVLKPLIRSFSGMEERVEKSRGKTSRPLQEEELEIPTSRSSEISRQAIIKKALEDPRRTTQLVRNWLREKK